MEKVIETKTCKHCNCKFDITDKDLEFYKKVSPVFDGKKYEISAPTFCPDCRQQRRLSWKNERNLYKRKCDATGKAIISIYSPDKGYKVYEQDFWWSDKWEKDNFFLDLDIKKSLFRQFSELNNIVPKRAVIKGTGSENCDYANYLGASKDSYLVFNGTACENSYYVDTMSDIYGCVDCSNIRDSSNCYNVIDSINCSKCFHSKNCVNCSDSRYLSNCTNCHNCFSCVNLQNKNYCIFNKEYSKDKYEEKLRKIMQLGFTYNDFRDFAINFPVRNLTIIGSENASGDIIHNSKHVKESYEIYDSEQISFSQNIFRGAYDCMDVSIGVNGSHKIYESSIINKNSRDVIFCFDCWNNCENLIYCSECKLCKDCFLCSGLNGKQYCILNKQYSEEEYLSIVPTIINQMKDFDEWGENFPSYISPYGYNETVANEAFPLKREEALKKGFSWSDYGAPIPQVDKIIPASKLPEKIEDVPDDVLNWAIECEITKKPFRIVLQELEFYRRHKLPIPRRHPDQRHLDRMKQRNPRKLYDRKCDKCKKDMQTTYSLERPETVYCQRCYELEIY